jgi:hypothetical protein
MMRKTLMLTVLVLGCRGGAGPVEPRGPADPSLPGHDWKEIRLSDPDGTGSRLVGFCYSEPAYDAGQVTYVYDTSQRRVGFVTPRGRAIRVVEQYDRANEFEEVGSGSLGFAISRILGLDRPVTIEDWTVEAGDIPPPSIR